MYLFNDMQLMHLVQKMPRNRQELLQISGFGQVKVEKYGDDILGIIAKYWYVWDAYSCGIEFPWHCIANRENKLSHWLW